jgi:hypothetical protein
VAVAQDLVQLFLDRDGPLIVEHDGLGGRRRLGPAAAGVVAAGEKRRLRVGEDEHLADPETELSGAGAVLGAILEHGEDLVEESLRDERLGLLALRERGEVLFFDAQVLFVRREPRDVARAIGSDGARPVLGGCFKLRSLDVKGIVRRVRSGR